MSKSHFWEKLQTFRQARYNKRNFNKKKVNTIDRYESYAKPHKTKKK